MRDITQMDDDEFERQVEERLIDGDFVTIINDGKPMKEGHFTVLCPWHDEGDTPSCVIDLVAGRFNCFGCGKRGTLEMAVIELKTEGVDN